MKIVRAVLFLACMFSTAYVYADVNDTATERRFSIPVGGGD